MTAMFEDSSRYITPFTGREPSPKPKSDMQVMQDNERKQHEQTYIYENGHNDHGMGQ
jgi:hypothetical protein